MPTIEELPAHLAGIVEHHGPRVVVAQLLKACPANMLQEMLQDACDHAMGVRLDDLDEQSALVRLPQRPFLIPLSHAIACPQVAIGEAVLHTPPTARRNVSILDRARVRGPIRAEAYIHLPCWFHEPDFGARDTECTALAVLRLLKDDLKEATRRVDDEEAENGVTF